MAIDSSHPPSPASDFPAEKTKTNQGAKNEARKDAVYKTKEITFRGGKKRIILQNENGPCPLIAICNVLLLRDEMDLYWEQDRFKVSQERLLSLVANLLIDVDSDYEQCLKNIELLPRFAEGINVNIRFRSIDDFEPAPELDIFRLLKIDLYHGWIVDPQDVETATAIGCKSYNDLMTGLVTLNTQTVNARSGQSSGECSVDPSQRFSKTRSFAYSTPTSAEHSKLRRGDIEEERMLLRALRLSEREKLGVDTRRDSSSGGESASGFSYGYQMSGFSSSGGETVSGFSYGYQMSEDDTLVDSESGCTTPCSSNINVGEEARSTTSITKSGADRSSATELGDDRVSDVETENSSKMTAVHVTLEKTNLASTKNDSSPEVCSTTSITKSGALDRDQPSSTELGDDRVSDVETENSCKMTAVHVTLEKTNLASTKNDSSPEIPLKSEAVTVVNPDLTGRSQDDDVPLHEAEKGVRLGSPVYEGESLPGQSSPEGKDTTNGLTPEEGELINNFLEDNSTQLTVSGLSYLQEKLKEDELCVFFRNNHFYTMLKYDNALYNLVSDEGYLKEGDVVWETLDQVEGDSVFMTGDFKVFKCDSSKWNEQDAVSNTADYIFNINSSSKEGMEIDPDLKMAMELQQQELSGGIHFEVSVRSNHLSSSIQEVKAAQRWQMQIMYINPPHVPLPLAYTSSLFSF